MSTPPASGKRSGLAPLELVLALPVLLFVTALIVNTGSMVMWRVRGEIVSRDAAWRSRWPRTGQREVPPPTWPASAVMRTEDEPQIAGLDHPDIRRPVARGPLPNGFRVTGILARDRGCKKGVSAVSRRTPMLPRLRTYRSGKVKNPVLDQKWACSEMGVRNVFRRSKLLYGLPATDQSLPHAMVQAGNNMFSIPHYNALFILDRDADSKRIRGYCRDFHPRIRHPYPPHQLVNTDRCELDTEVVRREEVERLIDTLDELGRAQLHQISHLPRTMTRFFLDMYRSRVRLLEAQIEGWRAQIEDLRNTWPPPPGRREQIELLEQMIADAEAEIDEIQPNIDPLEEYWEDLGAIESDLRAQVESGA